MLRPNSAKDLVIFPLSDVEEGRQILSPWFPILTGILNSIVAAYLVCRIPKSPVHGLDKLFLFTLAYLVLALVAGAIGCFLYWRPNRSGSRGFLIMVVLASAAAWVWLPAVVLLFLSGSLWMILFTVFAAVILAAAVRPLIFVNPASSVLEAGPAALFEKTLQPIPHDSKSLKLALCLYAAGFALKAGDIFTAGILFAVCAFTVTWQLTFPENDPERPDTFRRKAVARLLWHLLPAIPVTFVALLLWNRSPVVMSAGHDFWLQTGTVAASTARQQKKQKAARQPGVGAPGYQSIILWTPPEKKDFVLPSPIRPTLSLGSLAKPLVLRFSGAYWYFQAPYHEPGRRARTSLATPLTANIRSSNFIPLIMEAHQKLGFAFTPDCCKAIRVEMENCDKLPGEMFMGLMLADSSSVGRGSHRQPDLYLGTQQIVQTASIVQSSCSQKTEVLTFPIAKSSKRKFDELKILFALDPRRADIGAKVAVKQFEFVPR